MSLWRGNTWDITGYFTMLNLLLGLFSNKIQYNIPQDYQKTFDGMKYLMR